MLSDVLRDAVRSALSNWDIEVKSVEPLTHTENIVFKVSCSKNQCFVLRLHRPSYHNLKELLSEQKWTSALLESGLDVPIPKSTRDGHEYASIHLGAQMHQWSPLFNPGNPI